MLAAPIYHGDEGDPDTMVDSVMEAQTNLSEAGIEVEIEEAAADKGYHATDTLELADWLHIRTLYPGAEAERKSQLAGRARGEASGGDQQSASYPRRTEQAAATPAKRTGGKELCPCVRHRRCPAELVVWDREGPKALPDCRCGSQPGPDHAQGVRDRDAEGLAGRGWPCFFCLSCLASRSSRCAALVPRSNLTTRCFTFLRHCTVSEEKLGDFGLFQRPVRPGAFCGQEVRSHHHPQVPIGASQRHGIEEVKCGICLFQTGWSEIKTAGNSRWNRWGVRAGASPLAITIAM